MENLQPIIEALLFASARPLTFKDLEAILGEISLSDLKDAIEKIKCAYEQTQHGIYLEHVAGGYQFRTKLDKSPWLKKLIQASPHRLTRTQLETLAILAYKQPMTRIEVDAIRGVDSSHLLKVLLDKKLIRIIGVKETPGRSLIYGTTQEFLEFFNLSDLSALPSLEQLKELKGKDMEMPLFAKDTLDSNELEKLKEENKEMSLPLSPSIQDETFENSKENLKKTE